MEVSAKIKFLSFIAKIIGNPNLLKDDCDFKVLQQTDDMIAGTFAISGSLAKDLKGVFDDKRGTEKTQAG